MKKRFLIVLLAALLLFSGCGKRSSATETPSADPAPPAAETPPPAPEPTPAPHVHSYRASVVAPTESERGYTLYICDECGDTYKDNFVQPTGS